jgi:hypothetical protein
MALKVWVTFSFADHVMACRLQLCSVILMSKYVEMLYLYLTFQMVVIVAQIMFQVYDSSNIHSINICEVYILCQ